MSITDFRVPIECPECMATRIISPKKIWSDAFVYPSHTQPENPREKKRWKWINSTWVLTDPLPTIVVYKEEE